MNWDWDKLQQKRQRQPGSGPGPSFGDFNFEVKKLRQFDFPAGKIIFIIVLALWGLSGFYTVAPDEQGVVRRFGAFDRVAENGWHYHLPIPFESVETPKVTKVHRVEIGFRGIGRNDVAQQARTVEEESLMLTGDENIVDVQFIVQYKIGDAKKFLFNLKDQYETVKSAGEAAMREVVGYNLIDTVLTTGKLAIQNDCRDLLQDILDRYDCGIDLVAVQLQDVHPPKEVLDAFKDVASAREDKSRFINEADAYRNDLMPKARGQAAVMLNQAEAYKQTRIRQAKGDSSRYRSVLLEYNKAKEVTRERLYLETMENILSNPELEKIIIDSRAAGNVVPYLALDKLPKAKVATGGTQ